MRKLLLGVTLLVAASVTVSPVWSQSRPTAKSDENAKSAAAAIFKGMKRVDRARERRGGVFVFFNQGYSNLTSTAATLVKQTAAAAVSRHVRRIEVVGHADFTEGNAARLSRLRALTIVNALHRYGVSRRVHLSVRAVGAKNPLNGKRVAKSDNRYVWIVFR